jgi:hypothetical protein
MFLASFVYSPGEETYYNVDGDFMSGSVADATAFADEDSAYAVRRQLLARFPDADYVVVNRPRGGLTY